MHNCGQYSYTVILKDRIHKISLFSFSTLVLRFRIHVVVYKSDLFHAVNNTSMVLMFRYCKCSNYK